MENHHRFEASVSTDTNLHITQCIWLVCAPWVPKHQHFFFFFILCLYLVLCSNGWVLDHVCPTWLVLLVAFWNDLTIFVTQTAVIHNTDRWRTWSNTSADNLIFPVDNFLREIKSERASDSPLLLLVFVQTAANANFIFAVIVIFHVFSLRQKVTTAANGSQVSSVSSWRGERISAALQGEGRPPSNIDSLV